MLLNWKTSRPEADSPLRWRPTPALYTNAGQGMQLFLREALSVDASTKSGSVVLFWRLLLRRRHLGLRKMYFSANHPLQPPKNFRLGHGAHNAIDLHAGLQHEQGGYAAHVIARGGERVFITLSLATSKRPAISSASSSMTGATILQGPHPRRPHVEQHRQGRALNLRGEGGIRHGQRVLRQCQRFLAPPRTPARALLQLFPRHAISRAAGSAAEQLGIRIANFH